MTDIKKKDTESLEESSELAFSVEHPFVLTVNGEKVWESTCEAECIERVSLHSKRGEAGAVGIANNIDTVNIVVDIRDPVQSIYSDLEEINRARNIREKKEKAGAKAGSEERVLEKS